MADLRQSTATTRMVFMTDSADHVTGKTGLTLTITASKGGGALASITPTVTERGSGWYALALTTAHTDTLGDLALHITATAADASDVLFNVVDGSVTSVTGDVAGKLLGGGSGTITAIGANVNVVNIAGLAAAPDSSGSGTAQAGSTSTTIILASGASAIDNLYKGQLVSATGGTGAGQVRTIIGYVGATKVATVDRAWATTPNNTTTYSVLPADNPALDANLAVSGLSTTGVDAFWAKACTEPTAVVGASPTAIQALSWLNTLSRNRITQSATSQILFADNTTTVIATTTISDNGTTFVRGEFA